MGKFKKGEIVIHHAGTPHEQDVTYLSDFMYKGERWFNVMLSNGGFHETKFITTKQTTMIQLTPELLTTP